MRTILGSVFAAVLVFGVSSLPMAAVADEDKSKTSVELVCQCDAVAEVTTKASKAKDDEDKAKSLKDSKYSDESSDDGDKSKADDDYKSAKASKDEADKSKDAADKRVAGSPCTCSNGSSGYWGTTTGTSTGSTVPAAFREIRGE